MSQLWLQNLRQAVLRRTLLLNPATEHGLRVLQTISLCTHDAQDGLVDPESAPEKYHSTGNKLESRAQKRWRFTSMEAGANTKGQRFNFPKKLTKRILDNKEIVQDQELQKAVTGLVEEDTFGTHMVPSSGLDGPGAANHRKQYKRKASRPPVMYASSVKGNQPSRTGPFVTDPAGTGGRPQDSLGEVLGEVSSVKKADVDEGDRYPRSCSPDSLDQEAVSAEEFGTLANPGELLLPSDLKDPER